MRRSMERDGKLGPSSGCRSESLRHCIISVTNEIITPLRREWRHCINTDILGSHLGAHSTLGVQ